MMLRALSLVLIVTVGCGGGALDAGFESELSTTASCGGFFYAADDDGSVLLVFRPGSPAAEVAATESASELYDFEAGTVALLYVETGTGLFTSFCSDEGGQVSRRYHALGGTADFRAFAADGGGFDVTLAVRGLLLGEELGDHRVFAAELDLAGHMD